MEKYIIKIIEQELIGDNSIPCKLRNEHFFDKQAFKKLVNSIHNAIDFYKDQDNIPKRIALCFVDVSNNFFVNSNFFTESEMEEIEDAGMELSKLANQLFDN